MAKSAEAANVDLNLIFSIPKEAYKVFESVSGESVEEYLSKCVANYLSAYANGGLMLSEEDVQTISESLGDEGTSSSDVVSAITGQKLLASEEEGEFRIKIDPALVVNIKDSANVIGVTIDQWLNNCWGHIMANGWLYGISGDIRWIPFNLERIKEIEKEYGKPLDSSSSICALLSDLVGAKE